MLDRVLIESFRFVCGYRIIELPMKCVSSLRLRTPSASIHTLTTYKRAWARYVKVMYDCPSYLATAPPPTATPVPDGVSRWSSLAFSDVRRTLGTMDGTTVLAVHVEPG